MYAIPFESHPLISSSQLAETVPNGLFREKRVVLELHALTSDYSCLPINIEVS